MKILAQIGETDVWIDPSAVVAVFPDERYGADRPAVKILFLGEHAMDVADATVEDVLTILRRIAETEGGG